MTGAAGVVVLDLDDTLYLERDYVRSGFAAVGLHLARASAGDLAGAFASAAWRFFEAGRRGDIFDATLAELGIEPAPAVVAALVEVYRRHRPAIALADDAAAFLDHVVAARGLALVTDGFAVAQRNKIAALGLERWPFLPMLCTEMLGPGCSKPSPVAFEAVAVAQAGAQGRAIPPATMVYIADNATKDFAGPRGLGWRTVQIVRPGGLHRLPPPGASHCADLAVTSLAELTPERLDEILGREASVQIHAPA